MSKLTGQVAWVTGAGSGIGEAAAIALAEEGARVVLTGRTRAKLEAVAARIGPLAEVAPADLTDAMAVAGVAEGIKLRHGRCDILVNNAGLNITDRAWAKLTPAGIQELIGGNLASAFHCVIAVLPMMRAQGAKGGGGLMIHTASMAGRYVSPMGGPGYTAVKHGVVAMSHSINIEECANGIRSTALCPGEVRTPILDKRPNRLSEQELSEMVQPQDCGDLVRYIATLPPHVCINEVLITPTRNRGYLAQMARKL